MKPTSALRVIESTPEGADTKPPAVALRGTLDGPEGYALGRATIDQLETLRVAAVPLNYELWAYALCRPDSTLARRLRELVEARTTISEDISEKLAAEHLPRFRKAVLIDQASTVIDAELQQMASALSVAQSSTTSYASALRTAREALPNVSTAGDLRLISDDLLAATDRSEMQIRGLQSRLDLSARELHKLSTALERANAEARTDQLTGLWNRKAFDERIDSLVKQAHATDGRLGMALIDVDHFKKVNDTWGHQTGDQVLRFIASEIGRTAQPPRFCVRYGGEEFAILFPAEGRQAMVETLEKIRTSIYERQLRRRSTGESLGQLSVSAGYAELQPGQSAEDLIACADRALYTAKREGRNRTVLGQD
jgi:diguanylate cyclase